MVQSKKLFLVLLCMQAGTLLPEALGDLAAGLKKIAKKKPPLPPRPVKKEDIIAELKKNDNRLKHIFTNEEYQNVAALFDLTSLKRLQEGSDKDIEIFADTVFNKYPVWMLKTKWPFDIRTYEERYEDDLTKLASTNKAFVEFLRGNKNLGSVLAHSYSDVSEPSVRIMREFLLNPASENNEVRNVLKNKELEVLRIATLTENGRKKIKDFFYAMGDASKRKNMKNGWPFTEKRASFFDYLVGQDNDKKFKDFLLLPGYGNLVHEKLENLWDTFVAGLQNLKEDERIKAERSQVAFVAGVLVPYLDYIVGDKVMDLVQQSIIRDITEADSFSALVNIFKVKPEVYANAVYNRMTQGLLEKQIDAVKTDEELYSVLANIDALFVQELKNLDKEKKNKFVNFLLKDKVWLRAFAIYEDLRTKEVLNKFLKDLGGNGFDIAGLRKFLGNDTQVIIKNLNFRRSNDGWPFNGDDSGSESEVDED